MYKPKSTSISQMGPQAAYFAPYENIRSHITIEDYSRVDAMIALRMRANGHPPEAVLTAIRDCAPQIRNENQKFHDWQKYAERTTHYAFGYMGDRNIKQYEKYRKFWLKLEGGYKTENYHSRLC